MEADKWQLQDGGLMMRPMDQMMMQNSYAKSSPPTEKRPRPQRDHALNCPRCNSTNTKFCYYNNYSLTQPRYFCKTCRRYWTEGGSLRNVPVGGGSRKNKRPAFSTSPSPLTTTKSLDLNPDKCMGSQELSLTFPASSNYLALSQFSGSSGDPVAPISSHVPSLEFLRTGISQKGIPCYGAPPQSMAAYYTPYHQAEMKPSLSFPMEGDPVRTLFPFGEMKPMSGGGSEVEHQNKEQGASGGWWNGVLTGGSW